MNLLLGSEAAGKEAHGSLMDQLRKTQTSIIAAVTVDELETGTSGANEDVINPPHRAMLPPDSSVALASHSIWREIADRMAPRRAHQVWLYLSRPVMYHRPRVRMLHHAVPQASSLAKISEGLKESVQRRHRRHNLGRIGWAVELAEKKCYVPRTGDGPGGQGSAAGDAKGSGAVALIKEGFILKSGEHHKGKDDD